LRISYPTSITVPACWPNGHDDSEIAQGVTVVRFKDTSALVGFGSVGTVVGVVCTYYPDDAFSTKAELAAFVDVRRGLLASWLERVRAKPIPLSHPVWAVLLHSVLATYKVLIPGATE
jgi:hypothetical protein